MRKLLAILMILFFEGVFAQDLSDIENLYRKKQEYQALNQIDLVKKRHKKKPTFDLSPFLRWEVRILYELKDTERATASLISLQLLEDDLNYEEFPDKQEHFRAFFEKVLKEYDQDFVFVNKFKENADASPAVITVYKEKDIKNLGARTLIDLIRLTPGFVELGDNNERNFGTRGVYGTTVQHILVLINGHRINDLLTSTADPGWISLDYIQQVEFMRGPGSALYGGNAFSGVINIITKSTKDFQGSLIGLTAGSAQLANGTLSDHNYRLNFQHSQQLNSDKLYFSGTFNYSGGSKYTYDSSRGASEVLPDIRVSSGDTISPNTSGTEYINRYLPSYDFLVNYITPKINITARAQRSRLIINRPDSYNLWNKPDTKEKFKERRRLDAHEFVDFNYALLPKKNTNASMDLRLSFDHFHKDFYVHQYANFDQGANDSSKTRLIGDEWRWTGGLQLSLKNWLFGSNESVTIAGAQTVLNDWFYSYLVADSSLGYTYNPSNNFFEANKSSENLSALFVQRVQHILPDRLIATMGFRLNYHPIYSRFSKFRWGHELSPRMSLVYLSPNENKRLIPTKIKLLYNSAFLPPPFLYRQGGIVGFGGSQHLGSQTVGSIELNAFGQIVPGLTYSANHYVSRISNFISRSGSEYINEAGLRNIKGWEWEIKYKKDLNVPGISTSSFFNVSTLKYHETGHKNLVESIVDTNFHQPDSLQYPNLTLYAGLTAIYQYDKIRERSLNIGLTMSHYGKTKVIRRMHYDDAQQQWVEANEIDRINYSLPIFNLNLLLGLGKLDVGVSCHNLFNTKYQLPSPFAKSGRMLGERQTILFSLNFSFWGHEDD